MSAPRALVLIATSFPILGDGSEAAGSFVSDLAEELAKHPPVRVVAPGTRSTASAGPTTSTYSGCCAPASLGFFFLGCGYYAWTYTTMGRFTNMSALLLSASVIVFLIGLISEQITALTYRRDV